MLTKWLNSIQKETRVLVEVVVTNMSNPSHPADPALHGLVIVISQA